MSNNIGIISTTLSRTIGEALTITDASVFTTITGELDLGFIVYDDYGTIGVCTGFERDNEGNPTYIITTMSLNTEIDIQSILSANY